MYMMVLACLSGTMSAQAQNDKKSQTIKLSDGGTPLTTKQQEQYKQRMMSASAWHNLPKDIKEGLDFSKSTFNYHVRMVDSGYECAGILIPIEGKFAGKDFTLSYTTKYASTNPHCFGILHTTLKPEDVLPQHPKNKQYEKLSEKRFNLPPSAKDGLTPEQFEEVSTLMRIVKKNVDFLMNEPFAQLSVEEMRQGKYTGMLYPTHKPFEVDRRYSVDFRPYFQERETPLEFEINNKLGRFLPLKEIGVFAKQLNCFGECPDRANYSTEAGHLIFSLRLIPNRWMSRSNAENIITRVNNYEKEEIEEAFPKLLKGLGEIIQKRGVDPQNLPNIKSPDVPMYDKCLTWIYTQAKEVHDMVMESNILPYSTKGGMFVTGTLADHISIDPKNPGFIKQEKLKGKKLKNISLARGY